MIRNVVIVGLGLMGGSMAKAVRAYTDCKIYGWNRTRAVAEEAIREGTLDGFAEDDVLAQTDLLVISLYPQSTIDWLAEHMSKLNPDASSSISSVSSSAWSIPSRPSQNSTVYIMSAVTPWRVRSFPALPTLKPACSRMQA